MPCIMVDDSVSISRTAREYTSSPGGQESETVPAPQSTPARIVHHDRDGTREPCAVRVSHVSFCEGGTLVVVPCSVRREFIGRQLDFDSCRHRPCSSCSWSISFLRRASYTSNIAYSTGDLNYIFTNRKNRSDPRRQGVCRFSPFIQVSFTLFITTC